MRSIFAATLCLGLATQATAAQVHFCWQGANGYTMTGVMEYPDDAANLSMVTEADVTRFEITGYERGVEIGNWTPARSDVFHLRYDPQTMQFPTGGAYPGPQSQGWNASGEVNDCGDKGFGFNSGDYAQDLCLYGVWVEHSSVNPNSQLLASTTPFLPDCRLRELSS